MNKELFQEIGLSGHLAGIYDSLLTEGPASASELAKRTSLTRTNAYMLAERLVDMKLVVSTESHNRVYTANNPSQLKLLLSKKQQQVQEASRNLNTALPGLISKYRLTHQQPGVIHIEGTKGIRELYDDIIRTNQEILIFPSEHDRDNTQMANFIDGQILRQQLAGISSRVLYQGQRMDKDQILILEKRGVFVRYFGDKTYDSQIIVYGDNVAFSSFGHTVLTTIISSTEIAQTHRAIFESMWSRSR